MTFPSVRRAVALLAAVLLPALIVGCGSNPKDDPRNRSGESLYSEAKQDLEAGNLERAIKSLERVEALATGTLLGQQAMLDLAYALWRTDERAQALSTLDRFIRLHPSSPAFDYALYLRGLVNFNESLGLFGSIAGQDLSERDQRASRDAFQSFKQLSEQFPASRYAADARLRMDYIVNSLAAYEVHVARYYYRRGAYMAAANRAQQAVNDFQDSPAAEEALFIMVQSYERLELPELRDAADRVLRRSFPQSRFVAQAGGATLSTGGATRAWWRFW